MPNLLALVQKNRPFRDSFRVFELGHVYLLKGAVDDQRKPVDSAEKCDERRRLAGLSFIQSGVSLDDHYLEIKAAIEEIFGVKVAKVNTVRMQGKVKRTGAYPAGKQAAYKKAVVTLTADSKTIEFFEGMV